MNRYLSNKKILATIVILICHSFYNPTDSGAVQITQSNLDMVLASNEVVFINFYAECRLSNMLMPIFDDAADEVMKAGYDPGKVVMGKVDCNKEGAIATRFNISKPTLKLFRNGIPAKKEYRGQRSVAAFAEFIKKQLTDSVILFSHLKELHNLSEEQRHIIGYMDRRDQPEYDVFRKVAASLKDECLFHAGFGETSQQMHPPGQPIVVFRTDKKTSVEPDETYLGSLLNFDELYTWVQQKCLSFVRELTFENAEELTEEGLPLLILFHKPTDTESVKKYKEVIEREFVSEKRNINFLTTDGIRFKQPMNYLGKVPSDLPLIVIDSLQHMYLFPDFKDIEKPGKLKEFLQDLYAGKLQWCEVLHAVIIYGVFSPRRGYEVNMSSPQDSSSDVSSGAGVINITQNNFDSVLGSYEVVLISFYTEWCRFSSLMMPIFADAVEEISKAGILPGKVALAKIDCNIEGAIATRFNISSYPTIKLFRNGFSAKSNYRGPLTVEAFLKFIKEQLTDPVIQFSHTNELYDLSEDMWHVIAYLDSRDQPEYEVLRKVATSLKDECLFHAGFGEASQQMHPPGQPTVIFRTHRKTSVEPDKPYQGPFSFTALCTWVQEKCFPFVREITSEHAEKLNAEELPFLMLLHMPCDIEGVQKFIEAIRRELRSKKDKVNFLTVDGIRLERMLHLIGKSSSDLPLIIFVDYCRSIYLFPDYNVMDKPGTIKQFLQDVDSSKLHKQGYFLYKTSAVVNTEKPDTNEISGAADEDDVGDTFLGLFD